MEPSPLPLPALPSTAPASSSEALDSPLAPLAASVPAAERPSPPSVEPPSPLEPSAEAMATGAAAAVPLTAQAPSLAAALGPELASLREALQEAQRIAAASLASLDKLHQENQRLRVGELSQAMLPLWRDVIRLYDDVSQLAERPTSAAPQEPQGEVPSELQNWMLVRTLVTDLLYRQGVEPYYGQVGDAFDARLHKVAQPVPTLEAAQDRTLARVRRVGFIGPSGPVRLLEADVYRLQASIAP